MIEIRLERIWAKNSMNCQLLKPDKKYAFRLPISELVLLKLSFGLTIQIEK